ncbi:ankyrin [Neocallimastix lanati (nom. inval.)]|nr:ankyrin [Neocallimastix sp. JGI-2020a]
MKNENGDSLLANACKKGYKDIIKYLIKSGADINMKNVDGDTPLILLSYRTDISTIKYLYKNGADILLKNNDDESFLNIIKKNFNENDINEIKEILNQKREDGETLLTFACKTGDCEMINALIDFDVDVNIKNGYDETASLILCKTNYIDNNTKKDLFKKIIRKKGNINEVNKFGYTLLTMACYFINEELVEYLLSENANEVINVKNFDSDTSLTIACYFNNEKIIKSLVNKGAKVEEENDDNENALTISENFNSSEVTEYLKRFTDSSLSDQFSYDSDSDTYSSSSNSPEIYIQRSGKKIPVDYFTNIAKYSVCQIKCEKDIINCEKDIINATGFLVKLHIPMMNGTTKTLYGLMTNNHVIDLNYLKNYSEFKIIFKSINTDYTVKLDKSCFIFTCELIDVTFIELKKPLIKKLHKRNFLDCDVNDCKIDDTIYVIQYPKGEKLEFAHGKVEIIYGFDYLHSASTDKGSSGSPIINDDLKVVAIHKARRKGIINDDGKVNVATKISTALYGISTLYNSRNLIGTEKEKQLPKKLSIEENKELKKHGLEVTLSPQIFVLKSNNSPELLFYRTNYAWYWMKRSKIRKEKDLINIKKLRKCEWSIIKNITENQDNIEYYNNLSHLQKVIINFLRLTELSYLTGYINKNKIK